MPVNYVSNGPAPIDHNYRVTREELMAVIEYLEALAAESKGIADRRKECLAEAKARGYNTRVIQLLVRLRARDAADVAEEEAILELYREALGDGQ